MKKYIMAAALAAVLMAFSGPAAYAFKCMGTAHGCQLYPDGDPRNNIERIVQSNGVAEPSIGLAYRFALDRSFNVKPEDAGYKDYPTMRSELGQEVAAILARQRLTENFIRNPFSFIPNFKAPQESGFDNKRELLDFLVKLDGLLAGSSSAYHPGWGGMPEPSAEGYWPQPYCFFHRKACEDYNKN